MPLITASVFLAGALLSTVLPISLLICFAVFFMRQARRLPAEPAATPAQAPAETAAPAGASEETVASA